MKGIIKFFIIAIFIITNSFISFSQSNLENCEVARTKYLEQNPDVAKAKMDPWSHYQSFGKREGRIWPSCVIESSNKIPKFHLHECKYLLNGNVDASTAYNSSEEVIDKYKRITKKNTILFKEINGVKCCSIFYCSQFDLAVHH
jgi:hypothetical protein